MYTVNLSILTSMYGPFVLEFNFIFRMIMKGELSTVNVLKFLTLVCLPNRAWTNSVDPDQTASEEAVRSGSSLFIILTSFVILTSIL